MHAVSTLGPAIDPSIVAVLRPSCVPRATLGNVPFEIPPALPLISRTTHATLGLVVLYLTLKVLVPLYVVSVT